MAIRVYFSKNKVEYKSLDFMGYENYRVGDDGSVWSNRSGKWKELAQVSDSVGYKLVNPTNGKKIKLLKVHRLVLLAFTGPCPEGMESCHNDGDKANNNLTNLRWGTKKSNQGDRVKHRTAPRGEQNGGAKLTKHKVEAIRKLYETGNYTYQELAHISKVSKATIWRVIRGVTWNSV